MHEAKAHPLAGRSQAPGGGIVATWLAIAASARASNAGGVPGGATASNDATSHPATETE